MRKVIVAALIAMGMLVVSGTSAQAAVTGGDIANLSASQSYLYVSNGSLNATLVPNSNTINMASWHDKVQGFITWSNYRCRSQYSPAGSYPYAGNTWHWYSQNNLYLYITCISFPGGAPQAAASPSSIDFALTPKANPVWVWCAPSAKGTGICQA